MTVSRIRQLPDAEIASIRSRVAYDPETGTFTDRKTGQPMRRYVSDPKTGRAQISINRKHYISGRLAWLLAYGEWPEGVIDHIDHQPSNDRLANLRVTTDSGNQRNRSLSRNNASGFNGVSWCRHYKKWRAYIRLEGKPKTLGYFRTVEAAACARAAADAQHGYHANHGKASAHV